MRASSGHQPIHDTPFVMVQTVNISNRDVALLRFLDLTPATAAQIRRASVTFAGKPFRDERRARERLQALGDAGLVKSWPAAISGGGLMSYFRLTPEGYRTAYPQAADAPSRSSLSEIAPSRLRHAMATADAIVQTLVASHDRGVQVLRALGDGRLTLEVGEYRQQPDFHVQLSFAGHAVTQPILNDHHGCWQALVNPQPSSQFLREPVRLTPPVAPPRGL